jgi:hypothetical protein
MPDQPSTAPFTVPRAEACPRCDGPRDVDGWDCCSACVAAAHRAIERAGPGVVVTAAMIEAERHG